MLPERWNGDVETWWEGYWYVVDGGDIYRQNGSLNFDNFDDISRGGATLPAARGRALVFSAANGGASPRF